MKNERFVHYTKETSLKENEYIVYSYRPHTFICVYCNDTFKAKSIKSMYCSRRCSNDVAIDKRKKIAKEKRENAKNCVVCSKNIKQTRTKKIIKYCGNRCKQKQYRKNKVTI